MSKKFKITRKLTLISTAALAVIIVSSLGFWHYHNKPTQQTIAVAPEKSTTAAQSSSANPSDAASASDKETPSSGGFTTSDTQAPSNGTGQPPLTPGGQFISNHHVGGGNPTTETSVCITTPGAACYIKFTKGTTTLQLQSGTADSNGTVYWNGWDVKNYSFSSGDWTITAVATLNNQTKTASDQMALTIQ